MSKVALITGGASGMGLEVAKSLLNQNGTWIVHLLDLNEPPEIYNGAYFHRVDVTSYESLSVAFESVYKASNRLDFVYANAGIVERDNFYEIHSISEGQPPPEPNQLSIDINLKAVINTSYLALHYFRLSSRGGAGACLVATASCGGLYPSQFCPMYSAAKSGVINFIRSIAFSFYHNDGIRCYAICPGTVRTNLLDPEEWKSFPPAYFTPVEKIVSTVEMLTNGGNMEDSSGAQLPDGKNYGMAVEVSGGRHYFRNPPEYCDDAMKTVMVATSMENQAKRLEQYKSKSEKSANPALMNGLKVASTP